MELNYKFEYSNNFVDLFNKAIYENYVLDIMNASTRVFSGEYEKVVQQSNGECDFIEKVTKEKFDAKLPFLPKQIEMLTDGKRHKPQIIEWLKIMYDESVEFDPLKMREDDRYDITKLKLYQIMKKAIERDKEDENIVFFLPYPVVLSVRGSVFLQFCGDYLRMIYDKLKKEINIKKRKIYVIFCSSEKNVFAVRELGGYITDYIRCNSMEKYFSCEVTCV